MGQRPCHALKAGVPNTLQVAEVQLSQELVTHEDLAQVSVDHYILLLLIVTLFVMTGQLIEAD